MKKIAALIFAFIFMATAMVGCESGTDMVVEIYSCKNFEKNTLINTITKSTELVEIAGIIKESEKLESVKTESPNYIVEIYSSASKTSSVTVWFWVDTNNIKFSYLDSRDKLYQSPKSTSDFTKYIQQ